MKNIFYSIICATTLLFIATSCNNWIDGVVQTSTVTDEVIWQNEESVDLYMNGFYTYIDKYDILCHLLH